MQPDDGTTAGAGRDIDLIHVGPHEEQPAAASLHEILRSQGVGDGFGIESTAFIADQDREAVACRAAPLHRHLPRDVLTVSVPDGIDDRLADGYTDVIQLVVGESGLASDRVAHLLHEVEHAEGAAKLQAHQTRSVGHGALGTTELHAGSSCYSVRVSVVIAPSRTVRGRLTVPGDKSISHRYAMLAALADGVSTLTNYAPGADCQSTLSCLEALGVQVDRPGPGHITMTGRGLGGLRAAAGPVDCGNSGTTMRLMAGLLSAHPFITTLIGDASLTARPMRRVMAPLTEMGARIESADGGRPPLLVAGGPLRPIDFAPSTPSAQVKSAVLLAALHTTGTTSVTEPAQTRDHTERALDAFGVRVVRDGRTMRLTGPQRLTACALQVPGDLSSAAFPAAAAAALAGAEVSIDAVGLNPTRTALLEVLRRFGADVDTHVDSSLAGEPMGRIIVRHRECRPLVITPAEVPELIDELPVLAAMATIAGGLTVSGAGELRVKESDRISSLVGGLRAMGADATEAPDGFTITPSRTLTGGRVDAHGDHRLAMAFAIAALGASGSTTIDGADVVAVSYPGFFADLERLRA